MQSQFKIEAWESLQPSTPLSHRHQLKALNQIITKSKKVRRPLQLQLHTLNDETQQQHSFVSLKAYHNKYHTEEIHRQNSSVQVKNIDKRPYIKKQLIQLSQLQKPYEEKLHRLIRRRQEQLSYGQAFEGSTKKEPYHLKKIKSKPKSKNKTQTNKSQYQHQISKSKMENLSSKIRKYRTNVRSEQCLVVLPNFKEKTKTKFKPFFAQTIDDMKSAGEQKKNKNTKNAKKQLSPEDASRWKIMIDKSNRKKKQLEELFKTRPLFGNKQLQRRIGASNLSQLLQHQQKKAIIQRIAQTQFDDESLYCPWSYREQRWIKHFKSKSNR